VAEPGPALLTVILKLMLAPALTVCPSGVFTIDRFGRWQVMLPGSETLPWLVAFAHALLLYVVQLAKLVVLLTVALKFAPEASVPTLQLRICAAGYVPEIEQPAEAVVQVEAVPVGSVSLNITPVAEPGPALLTVILKLMLAPAFTV
jgi:hypothetical protein